MDGISLLNFLDTPFLVGDPDGCIVYANPAFCRCFSGGQGDLVGVEMASMLSGGGREAMLSAVADVCSTGSTVRFRLREEGRGFLGLASPIEAPAGTPLDPGGDRLGVVILLLDEPEVDARLTSVQHEIQEPLDEALACLDQLIDQTGGRRNEVFRGAVEGGMSALVRARKWTVELTAALQGRPGKLDVDQTLDPVRVLHQAFDRVAGQFEEAGVELDLLVPAQLPIAPGDAERLETAVVRLLRLRLAKAEAGSGVMLAGRTMGTDGVLISIVDPGRREGADEEGDDREPRSLCDAVEPRGGRVHTVSITGAGRATTVRLPLSVGGSVNTATDA
jgi:PAS domain-containing protein